MKRMSRTSRVMLGAAVAAALLVPLVAVAASRGDGERTPAAAPSFQRDVAPILREKCTGCHQVGGIAPFSLETARQAQKWADAIAGAVKAKVMPPWPPGPASPDYVGEESRQLTAQQRSTILSWAKAGGKASGPGAGKAPAAKTDVRPGERVLTLGMPAAYRPTAKNGATDDYRCFLLDPKLTEDAYATSARIVPRARVDRPPRDPLPHLRESRARGQAAGCRLVRRRLVVLRRHRRLAARATSWTTHRGSPRGRRAGERAASRTEPASRWRRASLVVMQVHYNLLNGRAPDRSRAVFTLAPPQRPEVDRHGAAARTGRARLRQGRARDGSATVTPRSPTWAGSTEPRRRSRRPRCSPSAGRTRRSPSRRRRPRATARCGVRPRSTSSAGTCTCSASRSAWSSTRAPRPLAFCSTFRAGTSTGRTRTPSRSRWRRRRETCCG